MFAKQIGVNRSHTVGAVRPDDREIRHPHPLDGALFNEADALDATVIRRVAAAHVVEKTAVDLVDDLELPRNQSFEQIHGPPLQRLRQKRVVRVSQRALRDAPGLIPRQMRLIQEDAHQLCHRQ